MLRRSQAEFFGLHRGWPPVEARRLPSSAPPSPPPHSGRCQFIYPAILSGKVFFLKILCRIHQADQHRHLDERPDDGGEAAPELMPNMATATAMASSEFDAAVKLNGADLE